jgi:hypothetical protein
MKWKGHMTFLIIKLTIFKRPVLDMPYVLVWWYQLTKTTKLAIQQIKIDSNKMCRAVS